MTNHITGNDVEFLSNTRTQHASQVRGMRTSQCGGIGTVFVGDPAAASHETKILGAGRWVLGLGKVKGAEDIRAFMLRNQQLGNLAENVLHFAEEASAFWLVFYTESFAQLMHEFTLLLV
jgi:hypothetical protein